MAWADPRGATLVVCRFQTVYYADGCGPGLKIITSKESMDAAHHKRRVFIKGNSSRTGAEQHQDAKSQCVPPFFFEASATRPTGAPGQVSVCRTAGVLAFFFQVSYVDGLFCTA